MYFRQAVASSLHFRAGETVAGAAAASALQRASERLLMEALNYNMLFRWFVGLNMDDMIPAIRQ